MTKLYDRKTKEVTTFHSMAVQDLDFCMAIHLVAYS